MLCKTFARVEIAGKRGRTVPILFTSSMQRSIDFLIKTRKDVGVHDNNHHLIPFGSLSPIRSSDSLYSFSRECVVAKPENITSINLRKHVATVSQIFNLEENELETMASFMESDRKVGGLGEDICTLSVTYGVGFMVFKILVSNISDTSWRLVLLVEEIEVPTASH